jgi:hypothetical protein
MKTESRVIAGMGALAMMWSVVAFADDASDFANSMESAAAWICQSANPYGQCMYTHVHWAYEQAVGQYTHYSEVAADGLFWQECANQLPPF